MGKKFKYSHNRDGDTVKVIIRDATYKVVYQNNFNVRDKNAIYALLKSLEKFSGISVYALIQEKLKLGEWW